MNVLEMKALAKQRFRRFRLVVLVLETATRTMLLPSPARYPTTQLGSPALKPPSLDRLPQLAALVDLIQLIDRPTLPRRLRRTTPHPSLQPRLQRPPWFRPWSTLCCPHHLEPRG